MNLFYPSSKAVPSISFTKVGQALLNIIILVLLSAHVISFFLSSISHLYLLVSFCRSTIAIQTTQTLQISSEFIMQLPHQNIGVLHKYCFVGQNLLLLLYTITTNNYLVMSYVSELWLTSRKLVHDAPGYVLLTIILKKYVLKHLRLT